MKCPVCGSSISRDSRHCDVCGSDLARRTPRGRGRAAERLPYDTHIEIDESSIQRSAVSELKETKAAYKEARRNAGKTNTPKVLAILLAVIIAAGAAAAATWYVMDQNVRAHETDMQLQIDEALAQVTAAQGEVASLRTQLKEAEEKIEQYEKAIAEEVVQNAANQSASTDTASDRQNESTSSSSQASNAASTGNDSSNGASATNSREESQNDRA